MYTVNRRQFLQRSILGFTALAGNPDCDSALSANPLGLPIGLQPFTVRRECEKDFEGTMKKVAEIGYKEVELYTPFFNRKPVELLNILKANGLSCPSAHFRGITKAEWGKDIEFAKALGLRYMLRPGPESSSPKSLEDYHRMADFFNEIGEQCHKAGIQFAYHNHNFEFQTLGGVVAYDELLRRTDPNLVRMQLDCFWVTRAGKDPLAYFERYPGRFPLLHVKDLKPSYLPTTSSAEEKGNPFTEVGQGIIDWKRIFGAAPQAGVKHYYVEQDTCDRPALESIRISYEYLHGLKV